MLFNKLNPEHLFRNGKITFLQLSKIRLQYPFKRRSRVVCKCIKTNTPHPPRDPPENYNPACFDHESFEIPENVQPLVFRPLNKEDILGPKAAKNNIYKNPEYYAYHRFSHIDLFQNAMRIRMEKRMQQMSPASEQATKAVCDEDEAKDAETKKDDKADCKDAGEDKKEKDIDKDCRIKEDERSEANKFNPPKISHEPGDHKKCD